MKFLDSDEEARNEEEEEPTTEQHLEDMGCCTIEAGEDLPEITVEGYLKAGYPFIHIRTDEDHRAVEMVKAAITAIDTMHGSVTYGEWKCTTGMRNAPVGTTDFDNRNSSSNPETTPVQALKTIADSKDSHVAIFHNMRPFVQIPQVIQQIKDTVFRARITGSHIIFVGTDLEIPPELRSLLTVYDLKLPNKDQFADEFRRLAGHYVSSLEEAPDDRGIDMAAASAVGMTQLQGENAISLSIAMKKKLSPIIIQLEKEQAIKRSDVLEFAHDLEPMANLGGFNELKVWIHKRRDSYTPEAREYGLRFPKGILLVGIPGTGKSLATKCIAHYFNLPLLKFDVGRIFRSLVGSSESATRSALRTAEAMAPVVLWVEEIDKSMSGAQSSGSTDSGTTARVMSTILTWMQENRKPVFLAATANNAGALPPELLRKGRFSEIWGCTEPDSSEREEIWNIHIRKVRPDKIKDFEYDQLVDASPEFTGAEIEGVVEEAMFEAWNDDRREMNTDDLIAGCQAIVPQAVMCKEQVSMIREWMKTKARNVSKPSLIVSPEETKTEQAFRKIQTAVDKDE